MRIAFHTPLLCIRGTTVALWDYAWYNQEILKNTSVILVPSSGISSSDTGIVTRFVSNFPVKTYTGIEELEKILEDEKCNVLYCIKYGKNDGIFSKKIKTVVHCVFDMSEPHGNVYAGVSKTLARKFGSSVYVPHMIGLRPSLTKENYRKKLGIPENGIVFGRYGGMDTFNIPFCWNVIRNILNCREDVYFLFANTPSVIVHPRIFYFDKVIEESEKNKFIHTCNAHLECGTLGHTFGLAIGENSVNNIPIIAYKSRSLWNTAHIDILGEKALYFQNEQEFFSILMSFSPESYKDKDLNCYRDYSPEKVMEIFKKVFLD
jgi:hypothetical protein